MATEPRCILLVEDEEAHAELIRRAFALRGAAKGLAVASTLTEARAYLARSRPDLVIADLLLPDGKGTELLDGDGAGVAYPLMVMTAHGDEQAAVNAMKAGALDYVVKSDVTFADMPRIADRALRQWRHITDRKRAEEKVRSREEQLRALASQLALAEERERRRIAAGLHDDVAQILATAGMKLQALQKTPPAKNLAAPLSEISGLVKQALADTRALTFDLSPPILYELGLEAACEWLAEKTQARHGITVAVEDDGNPKPLGEDIGIILFRAVRELLHNVAKHAQAQNARITIHRDGSNIRVRVADDGVGFDPTEPDPNPNINGGFGLFDLRERLDYFGGRLDIDSGLGRGTRVTLVAPLASENQPAGGDET